MEYLWTKEDKPLVLTDEVKDNQEELPFWFPTRVWGWG
jgi:hypothetical protein